MSRHRRVAQVSAVSLVLLTAFQTKQVSAAATPAPPTLASALAVVKPPTDDVVMTVEAAQCPLPSGETPPAPDASVPAVAGTFHRITRAFGTVTAVAPPTMTLLNTRPVNPNIYDGMPPQDAMKFLAASLTQGQWQQLKSDQGLGLPDLVSETQSSLFTAVLPRKLQVAPHLPASSDPLGTLPPGTRDLTASLPQVRLRLRRRVNLMVPQTGDSSFLFAEQPSGAGQETRYRLVSDDYFAPKASLYGVPVRAEVPNVPKSGDLDPDSPALRVAVPLAGVKTIGALLARVGRLAGLELYADRRWEGRALTVLGTPPSAPAADVLRSLAFCLTGAYRRVGPAFVLTDDVLGLGTRRAVLSEFAATASAMRQKALYAAGDALAGTESLTDLPPAADSMTYSATQKKEAERFYAQSGFSSANQTLDQLTPVQKAAVEATPAYTDPDGTAHIPDLSGQFIVSEVPYLELLVPALDGSVDASLSRMLYSLFQPSPPAPNTPTPPSSPAPSGGALLMPMAPLIKPIPSRAVLASPHTKAEVQDLVAGMKKLGLNQFWLPVVPAGNLAPLSQVIQATKGTDIGVYAVVDLLTRPKGGPADASDLTLLGRTSAQAQAALAEREALAGPSPFKPAVSLPALSGVAVSPFSAGVVKELSALTHTLLTTPGVAGIVWRATATPGYDEGLGTAPDRDGLALGYTPAARLAFLRREHVDPLDLFPSGASRSADISLPGLDDAALETTLETKWDRFRSDADKSLLQNLFRQVATDGAVLPVKPLLLVQQQGPRPPSVTWYGSWAGPDAPLPTYRPSTGVPVLEKVQARAQSKITLVNLPMPAPLEEAAILRQWSVGFQSLGKNHSWDGFVLDCLPGASTP